MGILTSLFVAALRNGLKLSISWTNNDCKLLAKGIGFDIFDTLTHKGSGLFTNKGVSSLELYMLGNQVAPTILIQLECDGWSEVTYQGTTIFRFNAMTGSYGMTPGSSYDIADVDIFIQYLFSLTLPSDSGW